MTTRRAERERFRTDSAVHLAEKAGLPSAPWTSERRVSGHFAYFSDSQTLVVAAGPQETDRDVDLALAYGLSYSCDRDLVLVLPAGRAAATLHRVAWLDVPIRVFEFDEAYIEPVVIPARIAVGERAKEQIAVGRHSLRNRQQWVAPLLDEIASDERLVEAHRSSYLAWHCRGRQVLKLRWTRSGVEAVAGVDYSKPSAHQQPALLLKLTAPITPPELAAVREAIEIAVRARIDGTDDGHAEHLLQASLEGPLRSAQLELVARELPALRPVGGRLERAFIDLACLDQNGDIHLIETKLDVDAMMVLQGLDYWTWSKGNLAELTGYLGASPRARVHLDFLVTPSALSSYSASQAEALSGEIPWRFGLVQGWGEKELTLSFGGRRTLPPPHAPRRFAGRLQQHLIESAPVGLRSGPFLPRPEDGLLPTAIPAYQALAQRGLLHDKVAHIRSSQAFALNLFGPLTPDTVGVLLARTLGVDVVDGEPPVFEFTDELDRLAERSPQSEHQTQVDVLLRGRAGDGRPLTLLVEVKLSEIDFSDCSGFEKLENDARPTCAARGAFGGDPLRCFQLRSGGAAGRRRYDAYLGRLAELPGYAGCTFRGGMNQPMRNIALARVLLEEQPGSLVGYALCAHDENVPIWTRWRDAGRVFGDDPGVVLCRLPASSVVSLHSADDAAWLRRRYRLPLGEGGG